MPMKSGICPRFSGFDRIRIAPTCATHSVRIVGGSAGDARRAVRQVALVERHVLDADDPFVRLELGDAIHQQKRIAVRQDAARSRVIQRQSQRIHRLAQYNSHARRLSAPRATDD